jgi:kinetochore protein Mis13/DSN1
MARDLLAEDCTKSTLSLMSDVATKIDRIHSFVSAALQTTQVCESYLDHRFALLSLARASRSQPVPPSFRSPSALASFLSANLTRPERGIDPRELLRALSRVDADRPPAQVGDAARSAVRQVERANQASVGGVAVSERRLTGVPPPTPRKPPGTPRRATTPGRER